MNRIPLSYIWRNLLTRRLTTFLTAGGMALVVFVFATVQMMVAGLESTLIETGSPDNVVVIRAAAQTEVNSSLERSQASILSTLPQIATDRAGHPLFAREVLVLISLTKKANHQPANVTVRGTEPLSLALRPQVKLASGRTFRPGSSEIVVGRSIASSFNGVALGDTLRFARREWQVVGILDAGQTAFNSEIWGDVEQMLQAFRRPVYSSAFFRLSNRQDFPVVKKQVEDDRRLQLEAWPEPAFYAEQSAFMANFIRILGVVLSTIFSLGAIIGAMITMYASVAHRTAEIGTLRAIGFRRSSILLAFLLESLFLGCCGGCVGLLGASMMQFLSISTMNFQTFAELAFSFRLTPAIIVNSLLFALFMGILGGVLPAIRAARLHIVDALRAA